MNKRRWISASFIVIAFIVVWNFPLAYRIGIDGKVFEKKIPLYAKVGGFLYRDWMYKDIIRGIVSNKMSEEEKVLAILKWTNKNISNEVPKGFKILDDHPLNIIIRQYGAGDQIDDIFTILSSYAGMKAGIVKCFNQNRTHKVILSFVYIDGRWVIFDASKNICFYNKKGKLGSIDDYNNGDLILPDKNSHGIDYAEYLADLRNIDFTSFTRAEEQMPFLRPVAEFKKMLTGIKK